jgi:hypothetical protein
MMKSSGRAERLALHIHLSGWLRPFLVDAKPASSEKSTLIRGALRQHILLRFAFCAGLAASVRGLALLISESFCRTLKRPPSVSRHAVIIRVGA